MPNVVKFGYTVIIERRRTDAVPDPTAYIGDFKTRLNENLKIGDLCTTNLDGLDCYCFIPNRGGKEPLFFVSNQEVMSMAQIPIEWLKNAPTETHTYFKISIFCYPEKYEQVDSFFQTYLKNDEQFSPSKLQQSKHYFPEVVNIRTASELNAQAVNYIRLLQTSSLNLDEFLKSFERRDYIVALCLLCDFKETPIIIDLFKTTLMLAQHNYEQINAKKSVKDLRCSVVGFATNKRNFWMLHALKHAGANMSEFEEKFPANRATTPTRASKH